MTDSSDQPSPPPKKRKNALIVSQIEWEAAKAFFNDPKNKNQVKFRRQHPEEVNPSGEATQASSKHSFIKVNGEIYAIANKQAVFGHLLGEGSFGKVKMVQNERGERFAVKVEGRGLRGENDTETQIMRLLNYLKGEASTVVSPRNFKNKPITEKLYTVTKIRKGKELFAHLYFDKNGRSKRIRSYQTRLNIALQSAYALQILHEKRIIHADVKPENFMADIHNNTVLIESIDYGLSLLLPAGKMSIELPYQSGTPIYMAPELLKGNPLFSYSFASDIYALGKMFSDDVLLTHSHEDPEAASMINIIMQYDQGLLELVRAMKDPDPTQRPTLTHIINLLTQQLNLLSQIGERQALLKDLESYTKTLREKKSKLKYSPIQSSKIDKRLEQAETLALIISKKYQGDATEPAALQAIEQDINDWRLPGKQISKLQEMIERLREINQEQVSIRIHMPHSRS